MLDKIKAILNLETKSISAACTTSTPGPPAAGKPGSFNESLNSLNEFKQFTMEVNGKVARTLTFNNNFEDPEVRLLGYGDLRLGYLKKDIQNDLNKLASMVGTRPASQILQIMHDTEGKTSSNMYIAYKLIALAEVEEFMQRASTKRRITMMRKGA
jgi:hypothetical protein